MALTEPSRATLFRRLSDLVEDEAAVAEMFSNFPTRVGDEPATREFVDARFAHYEAASEARFSRIDERFSQIDVRFSQVDVRFSQLEARLAEMETRLMVFVHEEIRTSMRWTIGMTFSLAMVLVAAVALFV